MKKEQKKGRKQADRGKASQTRNKGPLHEAKKFYCKNGLFKRCGEQAYILSGLSQ